jgi:hypothetical protein
MSLKISDYLFTGPFELRNSRRRSNHPPVVFAAVSRGGEPWNPTFRLISVGDTEGIETDFAALSEQEAWTDFCHAEPQIYFLDTIPEETDSAEARASIVSRIRNELKPPYGDIPIMAGT